MHNKLPGSNIVVYDCEIQNVIDGTNVTWNDHDKMGLSVACLFDFSTGDYHVYFDRDIQKLAARLNSADLVVAFNQIGFDEKLVRACGGDLGQVNNFDMLVECRKAVGWTPSQRFPKGLRLDDVLEGTFGKDLMKTDHGGNAPILWQKGEVGEVTTYCLADVKRETTLFSHLVEHGWFETATHGKRHVDLQKVFEVLK